jgi:hypothetical protein
MTVSNIVLYGVAGLAAFAFFRGNVSTKQPTSDKPANKNQLATIRDAVGKTAFDLRNGVKDAKETANAASAFFKNIGNELQSIF